MALCSKTGSATLCLTWIVRRGAQEKRAKTEKDQVNREGGKRWEEQNKVIGFPQYYCT